jgi:hypothetical protein
MTFNRHSINCSIQMHQKWNRTPYRHLIPAVLFLIIIPTVFGADFWIKKEYTNWSQRECTKMLQDSPWAKTYKESKTVMFANAMEVTGEDPYVQYIIQLRSALPIRQATVRLGQIAKNYDQLPPEQKKAFDEGAQTYLSSDASDVVIVNVEYETNVRAQELNLVNYWETKTTELLMNTTYLIGAEGRRVPLQQYILGQGGKRSFLFVFPRKYEGKPLLTPNEKSLKLEFECPTIGGIGGGRTYIEFSVKKMMIGADLIY